MNLNLSLIGKGPDHSLSHDLNFQQEEYEATHKVVSWLLFVFYLTLLYLPGVELATRGVGVRVKQVLTTSSSTQTFKNPKPELMERLRQSGPVPGDANGVTPSKEAAKKKGRKDKSVSLFLRTPLMRTFHTVDDYPTSWSARSTTSSHGIR